MREILFRGKSVETGKWVYGCYVKAEYSDRSGYGHFIFEVSANGDNFEINPETLGQDTGMLDKNGTKIFEGDCLGHRLNAVKYLYDGFCINGDRPLSWMNKDREIVGNIYDSAENRR